MPRKLSRRDFARTSMAVGAAVGLPTGLVNQDSGAQTRSADAGVEAAKRYRALLPPPLATAE